MGWKLNEYPTWEEMVQKKYLYGGGSSSVPDEKKETGNQAVTAPTFDYTKFADTAYGKSLLDQKNAAEKAVIDYRHNKQPFTYDINADELYQQYADLYANQGELAMKDTMAQAASLTGGYGNSYAQTAGQQVYQQYMDLLNSVGLDLEEKAYNRHQQEWRDGLDVLVDQRNHANTDYYKQLDAYLTEQQTANGLLQQNYANALTERQYNDAKNAANQIKPFTGASYADARAYLANLGVSADGLLTSSAWQTKKDNGEGAAANYATYEEYLYDYIDYILSQNE